MSAAGEACENVTPLRQIEARGASAPGLEIGILELPAVAQAICTAAQTSGSLALVVHRSEDEITPFDFARHSQAPKGLRKKERKRFGT